MSYIVKLEALLLLVALTFSSIPWALYLHQVDYNKRLQKVISEQAVKLNTCKPKTKRRFK